MNYLTSNFQATIFNFQSKFNDTLHQLGSAPTTCSLFGALVIVNSMKIPFSVIYCRREASVK